MSRRNIFMPSGDVDLEDCTFKRRIELALKDQLLAGEAIWEVDDEEEEDEESVAEMVMEVVVEVLVLSGVPVVVELALAPDPVPC